MKARIFQNLHSPGACWGFMVRGIRSGSAFHLAGELLDKWEELHPTFVVGGVGVSHEEDGGS
jgi:hypothetical protein